MAERIVGIYYPMDRELFEVRAPSWIQLMKDAYPVKASLTEWEIKIEEKTDNRIPVITSAEPIAHILHRYWKGNQSGKKIFGYDIRHDRLVFRVIQEPGALHTFSEIEAELAIWAPLWMKHFDIPSLEGSSVEYVNEISADRTPQFLNPEKTSIELTKTLGLFEAIKGAHLTLVPPLDCQFTLLYDKNVPRTAAVRIFSVNSTALTLQVHINVTTASKGKRTDLETTLKEIGISHSVAGEQFESLFTPSALASFQ